MSRRAAHRRSSVSAVLEALPLDPVAANALHDALWAVLWNRRFDDVDVPVWLPDAVIAGLLAFARPAAGAALVGVDTGDAFVVFRDMSEAPPIGSRVRILPAGLDQWKFADAGVSVGLGLDLRFDENRIATDAGWIAPLRLGLAALQASLEGRREALSARRSQLGAKNEPRAVESIWRDEVAAITERVTAATDYTREEQAALLRARARGPRQADEEERRITALRRGRMRERGADEVARFRSEQWPAMRERAEEALRAYHAYRAEVVRLEDAMQRIRAIGERAGKAQEMLHEIAEAAFNVRACTFDAGRLGEAGYAEELLRTVELLYAAIPRRGQAQATSFSAYRAPTAGPSVSPPRV